MEKEGRILHFEGIRNCRDLGGMITTSNQYIRKGLLLRSAHLKNATANDKYELQHNYHLTEILDLRNVTEQSENSGESLMKKTCRLMKYIPQWTSSM